MHEYAKTHVTSILFSIFFPYVAYETTYLLSTHAFLEKIFFCHSVPIINRHKFRLIRGTEQQKKMSSVRMHVSLMDRLLHKLYAEKNENAIDVTCVFTYSCELFK